MATRLALFAAALSVVVAAPLMPAPTLAQERDEKVPQVENSRFQFAGVINTNAVQIRSGPSDNYYATMRLDKGAEVTVVGIKFDWLKIVPPAGSYSLISKAFVQKEADAKTGTVIGTNIRVRAGSTLTQLKTAVQCMLKKGDSVTILGELDEYYQIAPPADAYLYVHQKHVDMRRQLNDKPLPATGKPTASAEVAVHESTPTTQPAAHIDTATNTNSSEPSAEETAAATKVREQEAKAAREAARVESEFDRLEATLKASLEQRLDEQPLAELIEGYDKLLASEHLSVPMRRISEIRLLGLRGKFQAQKELLTMRKQQQETTDRIEAIRAERQALEQKMSGNVILYTAVGKLQASTLQVGQGTLYRLIDPNTGRTLCYVRNSDPKYVTFVDQFVGVRGELTTDPQISLKVVNAAETETVEPEKVNNGITAQVSPPSFVTKAAEPQTKQPEEKPAKSE